MIILNRREKLRASALPPEIPDGDTLVKKTDKASASKLGLVKIGNNVNISSGGAISVPVGSAETAGVYKVGEGLSVDENGALSAAGGGFTFDLLLEKTTSTAQGAEVELLHDYTDYKVLFIEIGDGGNNNTQHGVIIVDAMSNSTVGTNLFYGSTLNGVRVVKSGDAIVPNKLCFYFSGSIAQIRIYGIK